ncbi:hypothetical protein NQ318_016283 [Aromia moschata]|uniref:Transposase n=1 Tax=Aromia moschata TaxID=1265417 RepID=A0AAV8XXE8_9CUCU|nr:hypothetical protein NQ318_016283 [Aromia moschata]
MIAETVNADKETVRKILHDELNMKKVCAKLVPKNLTPDQKLRQQICSDFLERLDEESELMENIITCDETWIYDVETKRQSMHWKTPASPRMKKAKMSRSKFKAMLIVFFDINDIVMTEWVPEGQTVNQNLLFESFGNTARARPRTAHNALSVKRYLAARGTPVLVHAPYSPDLAPYDFFLFPKVKSALNPVRVNGRGEAKIGGAPKGMERG